MIKVEKLKLPEGAIPQIDFGKEFEEDFDDKRKIRYLKKLSSAMNHAADVIQKERDELLYQLQVAVKSVEHADEAVAIQKDIVIKAITNHNAEKQNLIKRIQELETEAKVQDKLIKRMENGDYRRLDN
jgi:hypothetical protein